MDVSVVMPVKDTPPAYLKPAVQSVLDQEGVDFELVIVDDGSEEEWTTDTLKALAEGEERIRLLHPGEVGLGNARNLANDEARAPLIAPLDSDDVMLPGRLLTERRVLDRRPELMLVSGEMVHIGPDGAEIERTNYAQAMADRGPEEQLNCICHGAAMYRKDPIMNVGGYDSIERPGEDWRLWRRLWEQGQFRYTVLPKFLIKRRVWGGNTSFSRSSLLQRLYSEWGQSRDS